MGSDTGCWVLGLFRQDTSPGQRPAGQKRRAGEDARRLCSQRQGEPGVHGAHDADVGTAWTPRLRFGGKATASRGVTVIRAAPFS